MVHTGAMPDYEHAEEVDADADALFSFLAEVGNLQRYLPRITHAEPGKGAAVAVIAQLPDGEGGTEEKAREGSFRVHEDERRLEWGAKGPNDYHGELEVSEAGESSRVRVKIHLETDEYGSVDEALRKTLANVKRLVEESG